MFTHYSLSTVNGNAVPFDEGPLPPRPGTGDLCHSILFTGALDFEPSSSSFAIQYSQKDSCTDGLLGTSGASGTYQVDGSRVTFIADIGEGKSETYQGTLSETAVAVQTRYYAFVFVR